MRITAATLFATTFLLTLASEPLLADDSSAAVTFDQHDSSLTIRIGDQPVAEYVWEHDKVLRPFFKHLRTRSGMQVTRTFPPVPGKDPVDHDTFHPGLWLGFGDLNGTDFWRNQGRVRHDGFIAKPQGGSGRGSFAVRNIYEADGKPLCTEACEITIIPQAGGYLLKWVSTFESPAAFTFGDQEEMGFGVRMHTPLIVKEGGEILDSEGRRNEKQVWGHKADWCQYRGVIDGRRVGIVSMPDPQNFRPSWFHARDYGLLVANAFGANAFTKGPKSKVTISPGAKFRLGFGLCIFETPADQDFDAAAAYRDFLKEATP
jgi:hypothetical protein